MANDILLNAEINGIRFKEQGSDPASPASGYQLVYVKSGGVYVKNAGGNVTGPFGTGGGGSGWKYPADGRLTLAIGTPVTIADQAAKSTLYYTPYVGDQIALYDGAGTWNLRTFTELSLDISAYTASKPYDIFCYDNAGTPTLEGLVWTNDTARATALTYQNGILVKTGATTRRYLGTIRITATTGQCEDSVIKRFVWNYYHRVQRWLLKTNSTSHSYYGAYRAWNNDAAHKLEFVCGLAEDSFQGILRVNAYQSNAANAWETVLNLDSFTVLDANVNYAYQSGNQTANTNQEIVSAVFSPQVGYHYLAVVEGGAVTNSTYPAYDARAQIPM